jgi:phosphoglycerate dehydrogenase-like enzyme
MALLGRAFGMRVLAHRRTSEPAPDGVDRLYCLDRGEGIDELLETSDVIMLATSLTDQTYHLIGTEQLARMKRTAYLINLARGAVVDERALVTALESGEIAGAGLNVFEQEPLPSDAPIWSAPNVIITPHETPVLPDRAQRVIDMVRENARRYRAEEELMNQLKPNDVYTKRTG